MAEKFSCSKLLACIVLLALGGCAQQPPSSTPVQNQPTGQPAQTTPDHPANAAKLADIRYRVSDPAAATVFFQRHFGFQPNTERPPLPDVTLLTRAPETAALMLAKLKQAPKTAPHYGVYWLAFGVKNLSATLARFQQDAVQTEEFTLPAETARAALINGPDNTKLVLVERSEQSRPLVIDHLQLLVEDLQANIRFFQDVYAARLLEQTTPHTARLAAGGYVFVLSTPPALGLSVDSVKRLPTGVAGFGVDQLSFAYGMIAPVVTRAQGLDYKFLLTPTRLKYAGRETPYTFAVLFAPNGLQCELYELAEVTQP